MREKIFILTIVILLVVSIVYADPYGPTSVDVASSTTRTSFGSGSQTVDAEAGNVTEVLISSYTVTKRWQGYYGNVTGAVTLDNADNWTLYSWDEITSPEGEVYAANDTVTDWSQVICVNISYGRPGYNCSLTETDGANPECINLTEIEDKYGISSPDSDGFNETFNATMGSIIVGTNTLYDCPMVNLYVNNTYGGTAHWNETILTINNTETIIFASVIESDGQGFNNRSTDFQMIVGEDGDDPTITVYNFYVELT